MSKASLARQSTEMDIDAFRPGLERGASVAEQRAVLAEARGLELLLRDEPQRRAVDAVALSRRRRPVVEDVAEMAVRVAAAHLGAHREPAAVFALDHRAGQRAR